MKHQLLIKKATLVTFFNDGYNAIKIVNTDILVEDGIITKIDRDIHVPETENLEIIDGAGKLAIPGLINSRSRSLASRVSKSISEDIDCGKYGGTPLYTRVNPFINIALEVLDEHELEALMEPTIYEAIESGTTTLVEHAQGKELQAYLNLCEKYGLRTVAAPMIMNGKYLPEADCWGNYYNYPDAESMDKDAFSISQTIDLIQKYNGHPHIKVCFGLGSADTVTGQIVKETAEKAVEMGTNILIPINETEKEINLCLEREGLRPLEFFRKYHALNEKTILGGLMEANEEDKNIIKSMSCHAVSCQYQAMLDGMLPPFIEFLLKDINVATGTGRCSVNMLEQLKISALAGKLKTSKRQQMQAPDAFYAATQAGADLLNMPIGRLEEGALGDILLIELREPSMHPIAMPVQELVYHTKTSDVSEVIIAGKIIKKDGIVKNANLDQMITESERVMEKVWECARDRGVF